MNTKLVSSIAAVTRSRLVTIGVDGSVLDAARLLSDTQISLVVVCNADRTMAGVVTKTNIVRQIAHCHGSSCTIAVAEIMTANATFCRNTDFLPQVLAMMTERGYVHVPVIDDNRRPLGVVNARDALRELMLEEQYEEALLRDYVMGVGYR